MQHFFFTGKILPSCQDERDQSRADKQAAERRCTEAEEVQRIECLRVVVVVVVAVVVVVVDDNEKRGSI